MITASPPPQTDTESRGCGLCKMIKGAFAKLRSGRGGTQRTTPPTLDDNLNALAKRQVRNERVVYPSASDESIN